MKQKYRQVISSRLDQAEETMKYMTSHLKLII